MIRDDKIAQIILYGDPQKSYQFSIDKSVVCVDSEQKAI